MQEFRIDLAGMVPYPLGKTTIEGVIAMSNANITTDLETIVNTLTAAIADANKFDNGNASAGTRVRKAAMEATKSLKNLRATVTEVKNARA